MSSLPGESFTGTELPRNVKVGNYSSIGSGCRFHFNDQHLCVVNKKCVYTTNWRQPTDFEGQEITIGNDVWIGEGVRVLEGVTIGDGAIIGAGSVIAKDVPAFAVVVGNPQQITRMRFTDEQIQKLKKIAWWNWDNDRVSEAREDMLDIDKFIRKYEDEANAR